MNEITIGDKLYISSKRAAEITGYAKDYVGQLCREGHVDAKMVGRGWYVFEPSIRKHRFGDEVIEARDSELDLSEQRYASRESPVYAAETPVSVPELREPKPLPDAAHDAEPMLTDMQSAWKEWFEHRQSIAIESPEVIEAREEYVAEHKEVGLSDPEVEHIELYNELEKGETDSFHEEDLLLHAAQAPVEEDTAEEVSVPLHKIVPAQPISEHAPEQRTYTDVIPGRPTEVQQARVIHERVVQKRKSARFASNAPLTALFVALSVLSIVIAAIGSGLLDSYITTIGGENPVVEFILGKYEYINQ